MKTWQKVTIGVGAVAVLGAIVWISVNQANKGVVTVQTAKVAKQDSLVSQVTASGEVKPTTYTNVTAQGFGRIIEILVKEGDRIKKGDRLLLQENVQANADVEGQTASLSSAAATMRSMESAFKSVQGEVAQANADAEKSKLDWERARNLYKDGLIAKEEYDRRRLTFESDSAKVEQKTALVEQRRAELEYARWILAQGQATLKRAKDVLNKTTYTSPINGIVSYLPVRLGEYVVPGIQNSNGSFLMTLSDMSVVTAEVKVD
jgi:HlyD family secretion protein